MQIELLLRLIATVSIIGVPVVSYSQHGFMRAVLSLAMGCLVWGVIFWWISPPFKGDTTRRADD